MARSRQVYSKNAKRGLSPSSTKNFLGRALFLWRMHQQGVPFSCLPIPADDTFRCIMMSGRSLSGALALFGRSMCPLSCHLWRAVMQRKLEETLEAIAIRLAIYTPCHFLTFMQVCVLEKNANEFNSILRLVTMNYGGSISLASKEVQFHPGTTSRSINLFGLERNYRSNLAAT